MDNLENITAELIAPRKPSLKERLLNVHTVQALGMAFTGFGVLKADQVQQAIDNSGGSLLSAVLGLSALVVAGIYRA